MNARVRAVMTAGCNGAPPSVRSAAAAALLGALPALGFALSPAATIWAAYDRGGIAAGELWRVATCHWTHWSLDHLGWDLLAFLILVPACWRTGRRRLLSTLAAAGALIPVAIWHGLPGMLEYRGLSGLDSALFMLLATSLLRRELADRRWGMAGAFALAIAAFSAKVGFEAVTGSTLFVESAGFIPVPLAHVVGGACGAVFGLWPGDVHGFCSTPWGSVVHSRGERAMDRRGEGLAQG